MARGRRSLQRIIERDLDKLDCLEEFEKVPSDIDVHEPEPLRTAYQGSDRSWSDHKIDFVISYNKMLKRLGMMGERE